MLTDLTKQAIKMLSSVKINIENSVFDKTGNTTSDDNSNFRGQNAVVLGIGVVKSILKGSNITSNSKGSNAVFATGEGSVINVENTNIHTKAIPLVV